MNLNLKSKTLTFVVSQGLSVGNRKGLYITKNVLYPQLKPFTSDEGKIGRKLAFFQKGFDRA
jgi:hypothetical protein